ncbi:MAG: ABC transporter substrate-binding protein [Candidatus Desulforudis sp.]|nr:ABC transporter substrate-binding protein [Desulforudis sp.]
MRKPLVIIAAVLALAGVGAAAWYFFYPKPAPEVHRLEIRETAREVAYLPHYLAAALGYFEDYELHLSISTAPKGVLDFENETADLFLVPLDRLMVDGPVAFAGLTRRDPSFLMGREAVAEFKWEDLQDRTVIGDPPDGAGEMALEEILRKYEMIPQTHVNIVQHLPVHLRVGTFLSGSGSYIILPDPMAAYLEKSETAHVLASLAQAGGIPSRVTAAKPEFLQNHPDAALGYTMAVFRAQDWIEKHAPAEIAVVAAPFFPYLDLDTLTRAVERNKDADLWAKTPLIDEQHYQNLQDWLIRSGELPQAVPYPQTVEPSFAREAVEQGIPQPEK